ncbi:hypothetical protein [Mangrovibacter phragmitis]|uniref:hypothetical protein n=1 Tax=Mangrovibacter phragmitis TaxID=1691903 RepID=UPI00336A07D1
MKNDVKPCPICNTPSKFSEKIFHEFNEVSGMTIKPIPSSVFACKTHGLFAISEKLEDILSNNPHSGFLFQLEAKVSQQFIPFDGDISSVKVIESL